MPTLDARLMPRDSGSWDSAIRSRGPACCDVWHEKGLVDEAADILRLLPKDPRSAGSEGGSCPGTKVRSDTEGILSNSEPPRGEASTSGWFAVALWVQHWTQEVQDLKDVDLVRVVRVCLAQPTWIELGLLVFREKISESVVYQHHRTEHRRLRNRIAGGVQDDRCRRR